MTNTCKTCKFIGDHYWGDAWSPVHFCKKSDQRRADNFRSCGNAADDFMNEFRKFYDATPNGAACKYYEQREVLDQKCLAVLNEVQTAGGTARFPYFSEQNAIATKMHGVFLTARWSDPLQDGKREYSITDIGIAAIGMATSTHAVSP